MTGKREKMGEGPHAGSSGPNLGQKEAVLEKASEEQLSHMEGGKSAEAARRQKARAVDGGKPRNGQQH